MPGDVRDADIVDNPAQSSVDVNNDDGPDGNNNNIIITTIKNGKFIFSAATFHIAE